MSVHSAFSPSAACKRFSAVSPSSPSALNQSLACSFSFSAVCKNNAAICSYPAFFATEAKYVYLFLACDSPANASQRFFSVFVPAYLLFDDTASSFLNADAGCLHTGHCSGGCCK